MKKLGVSWTVLQSFLQTEAVKWIELMGTRKIFSFSTHFDLVNGGSVNQFLFRNMVLLVSSFWVFICWCIFHLIGFTSKYIFRFQGDDGPRKDDSNCSTVLPQEDNLIVSNWSGAGHEPETVDSEDTEQDEFGEKDTPKFCFKFQFQSSEDIQRSNRESEGSVSPEKAPMVSTSRYQFSSGKDFCRFMEEPEVVSFTVKELYADSNCGSFSNKDIIDRGFLSEKDFQKLNSEKVENSSTDHLGKAEEPEETEAAKLNEEHLSEKKELVGSEIKLPGEANISNEAQFLCEKDFFALDSDPESINLSDRFSLKNILLDPTSDEFLSEKDFGGGSEAEILSDFDGEKVERTEEIQSLQNTDILNTETIDTISDESLSVQSSIRDELEALHREEIEIVEEIQNPEEPHLQNSSNLDTGILSDEDFQEEEENPEYKLFSDEETEADDDNFGRFEEPHLQNSSVLEFEDEDEDEDDLETLWEHQDLIEQLKLELRKVKATRLPTILEESETPKSMEDLKPWKIDEKFLHEDRMDELHKFYKSYKERMRKFDILNYQKMHAIGFLQLKDPLQSISSRKSSTLAITAILSQNFWLCKRRRAEADPTIKFIGELQSDLEVVYVGQTCLSWEILHWQFEKAQELQESDPHGFHQYNQVAGEFQQFQVHMQRFLENEAFQGPRVQNYVKNRCVLRNLLQVPVIKEDQLKDKMKVRSRDDAITITMLIEIIHESMRTFWEFVRADKVEANVILKGLLGTHVELQNPADEKLLMDIRTSIQKKEKKLKDLLRTGNCIVKKLQKHQEVRSDKVTFFSQVDIKLVSRVLNMSRITTEQLVWCHMKLNRVNFVNRKIHRDPSFLLFPC